MTLSKGDQLPDATLGKLGAEGPEMVSVASLTKGKKVVLFGLPGAFTGTCTTAHLPSFMRTADKFRAKGVDHMVCLSVNDVFVMKAWADATGAEKAGIEMLCDGMAEFTKAAGMDFTAPPVGLVNRCKRFSAYVVDGKVEILNVEDDNGVCEISAGETLLEQIG